MLSPYLAQAPIALYLPITLLIIFLSIPINGFRNHPQYILVNKASFYGGPYAWNQDNPSTCNQASIDDILSTVKTLGNDKRKLGVSVQINAFDTYTTETHEFLQNLFNLSITNDLPIGFAIDSFEFWDTRPDLWNWYNSSLPGYDPTNIQNVESTDWVLTNDTAVGISWRDWGSQFRVSPHPNLASPAVLAAYTNAVRPYIMETAQFYNSLPESKQYLLAYVKVSWEISIGTNFYFYPNGNQYINQDPHNDPSTGIIDSVQVGYNSVCTLGVQCNGNITVNALDTVVRNYLSTMGNVFLQENLPRNKLFTHGGASFGKSLSNHSILNSEQAAVIPQANPGWSFYSYAYNASAAPGIDVALDSLNNSPWGATEWYYMGGNTGNTEQQWITAFTNTLNYRNARLVDVFNWESMRTDTNGAVAGLQTVLNGSPDCLVDTVDSFTVSSINRTTVTLNWNIGPDTDTLFLDVATVPYTLPSGELSSPGIVNHQNISNQQTYTFTVPESYIGATLFGSIVSIGCNNQQLMVSSTISWIIPTPEE